MCDIRTIHFVYWDVSHRSVSSEFLEHIQQAGYRVLYAGVATCPRRGTRRAWIECRKHEPEENDNGATILNVNKVKDPDQDENDVYRVTCKHCDEEYLPDEAGSITILGPGEVWYTCPQCGQGTNGPSPLINKE